jgi:hypothetical protein
MNPNCSRVYPQPVRSAYQPPASSTFLSERTSCQQPASSTLLSEQTSTSHQPTEQATSQQRKGTSGNKKVAQILFQEQKKRRLRFLGKCS